MGQGREPADREGLRSQRSGQGTALGLLAAISRQCICTQKFAMIYSKLLSARYAHQTRKPGGERRRFWPLPRLLLGILAASTVCLIRQYDRCPKRLSRRFRCPARRGEARIGAIGPADGYHCCQPIRPAPGTPSSHACPMGGLIGVCGTEGMRGKVRRMVNGGDGTDGRKIPQAVIQRLRIDDAAHGVDDVRT